MDRYLESGNLIVRTDSFDMKELSKPPYKKDISEKDNKNTPIENTTWKNLTIGNNNDIKNLNKTNFPQLR